MNTEVNILIVDDDPAVRKTISDTLKTRGYKPTAVATGKAALDKVEEDVPIVAMIDLVLEDMSGLEVMRKLKERCPSTECILLTGHTSQESAIEAVNLGAYSYLQKPYEIEQLLVTTRRAIEKQEAEKSLRESEERYRTLFEGVPVGLYRTTPEGQILDVNPALVEMLGFPDRETMLTLNTADGYVNPEDRAPWQVLMERERIVLDFEVQWRRYDGTTIGVRENARSIRDADGRVLYYEGAMEDITERKRTEHELRHSYAVLRRTLDETVHALAAIAEGRDPFAVGHHQRVTRLACAIAKEMGLSEEQIEGLRMAVLIHDIGKTSVPVEVLVNPIPLSDLEHGLMNMHAQAGYHILKTIEFPWPVAEIVLQHHEMLDGSGYPQGLSGDDILLEARILAVANLVDIMTSRQPQRLALSIDEALEEISQNRGVRYDPQVVDACLELFTEKGFKFE